MRKILVSKNQHYSCLRCGRCCKRFNVRIELAEIQRIQSLDWGDEPHPVDFYETIHGHYYFKRKPDGGCIFLDDSGSCRIHARFGFDVKALTCRGYPMNIISTAPDELSVLARMDCPAVLANFGEPLVKQQQHIMTLVSEMTFGNGFDTMTRNGIDRKSLDFIIAELHKIVKDRQLTLPRRLFWMMLLAERCMGLGASFLNDLPTLKTVWLNLMRKTAQTADAYVTKARISITQRTMFRAWLALYCRRDEENVTRGFGTRIRNFWHNLTFITGTASWRTMGFEHPDISSRQAGLFRTPAPSIPDDDTWAPYLEFLVNRLDTLQFFGSAYYNINFAKGIRALLLTFPLVLASAIANAAARTKATADAQPNQIGVPVITREDVFNAVLAIDHCHGRSPALNSVMARIFENTFATRYLELIAGMARI